MSVADVALESGPAAAAAAESAAVLQHLLPPAALAAPFVLAAGRVEASQLLMRHQPGGYLMHPAMLDAATHTAAVLQAAQQAEQGVTRIPVGAHTVLAPPATAVARPAPRWCQGRVAGLEADGTALADFMLAASSHSSVQLAGFQAKVVGGAAAIKAAAAAAAAANSGQQASELLYIIDWQAEQPAAGTLTASQRQAHAWHLARSGGSTTHATVRAAAARSPAGACVVASDGLGMLQRLLARQPASTVSLQVAAAPSLLPSAAACQAPAAAAVAASLAGLFKVAGMEFPSASLSSSSVDALMPGGAALPAAADALGIAVTASASLRAKLLRQPASVAPPNSHLLPMPRGSLADLRLAVHSQTEPGPGEVKASGMSVPCCAAPRCSQLRVISCLRLGWVSQPVPAPLPPACPQVAVRAVGLNFRDVLNVLGMYPGDPGPPGADCAGVVEAAGAGVHDFAPGGRQRSVIIHE